MKHTPGPWAIHDGGRFDALHESGPSICAEHPNNTCQPLFELCGPADPQEREANARLVAAAPDLLAACKALLADATQEGPCWCVGEAPDDITTPPPCEACQARAAIAKAE